MRTTIVSDARRRLAIALVAAAVIVLQISITRILSVVLWYHWAFFAISLAMLGLGVPGVWLTIWRPRAALKNFLLVATVAIPAGVAAIIHGSQHFSAHNIIYSMLVLLPAVIALGGAVCVLLLDAPGKSIGKMYAWDLLGACVGALVTVPLMWVVPTPQLAAGLGLLPLVAYFLVGGQRKLIAGLLAAALVGLCCTPSALRLRFNKEHPEIGPVLVPMFERWTPTARLTVLDSVFWLGERGTFRWGQIDARGGFRWGEGKHAQRKLVLPQYWMTQDGSAGTPITNFNGDKSTLAFLFDDITAFAYEWRPPKRVAIVGGGGGRDILSAYYAGATDIDVIELNRGIVEALRGEFRTFSGGVYDLPGVNAIIDEGRSALTRSPGNYDLIQISMIDSWAATAAGAYALSENNLYTIEAYRLYWRRLSEKGLLSTSRWMLNTGFGFELPRLILLVHEALKQEGVATPTAHIALAQGSRVGTLLVSKSPLVEQQIRDLHQICERRGFVAHYPAPAEASAPDLVSRTLEGGHKRFNELGIRLAPPTDDQPFFFQSLSPFQEPPPALLKVTGFNGQGTAALRQLMGLTALITLVLFFLPFALRRRIVRGDQFWRGSAYFTAIGLSFMVVEIAWLQRFILYVGHPSVAVAVALGSMLLGAGLGSMVSVRVGVARLKRFGWLAALIIALLNLALSPIFAATLGMPWWARIFTSIVLIVPAAFAMGMFFPLGMVRFGDTSKAWYWALNGAAGVLASVTSLALAMEFGFLRVGLIGAALYLAAWLLVRGPAITHENTDAV